MNISKIFKQAILNLVNQGIYTIDYAIIKSSELAQNNRINANDYDELIKYLAEKQEQEIQPIENQDIVTEEPQEGSHVA